MSLCFPSCSNNSLSALPDDLLSVFPVFDISLVDLSRNKFTATGVAHLQLVLAGLATSPHVDLSFNDIGPSVPPSFATWNMGPSSTLLLMGCGITDVQPDAFAATVLGSIDLSLNDLRSGLHAQSFSGAHWVSRIGLSNCNLRSSSLVPGMFDLFQFVTYSYGAFFYGQHGRRFQRCGLVDALSPLGPVAEGATRSTSALRRRDQSTRPGTH